MKTKKIMNETKMNKREMKQLQKRNIVVLNPPLNLNLTLAGHM